MLTLFAVLGASAGASAAPVIGLQAVGVPPRPGFFVLDARPGARLSGRVKVTNTGSAGTVLLTGVDATTGATTGAVYRSRREPRVGVGRWVHVSTPKVAIGAGQAKLVPFQVTVPADANPGQHLGGIVAEALSPTFRHTTKRGKRSFTVKIKELSVVAVEVKLPGPVFQKMAITGIWTGTQAGRQTIDLGLANTGNVFLTGSGSLVVSAVGGRAVLRQSFKLDTFVPGTRIADPLVVAKRTLPAGQYRGTVRLTYGRGRRLVRTLRFSIGSGQLAHLASVNQPPAPPSRPSSPLLLIVAGLGLVLLGMTASAMYFRAQVRKSTVAGGNNGDAER
jgi:hypothetical protein